VAVAVREGKMALIMKTATAILAVYKAILSTINLLVAIRAKHWCDVFGVF